MRASYVPSVPASTRGGGADRDWSPGLGVPGALPGAALLCALPCFAAFPWSSRGPSPRGSGQWPKEAFACWTPGPSVQGTVTGTEELTL